MRILVADDHVIVRKGLVSLLNETFPQAAITEASNGYEVLEKLTDNTWNLLLMDLSMGGLNGFETLKQLRSKGITIPILILSVQPEDQYALRVIKAGASGYINKDSSTSELVRAFNNLLNGHIYVSPAVEKKIKENYYEHHDTHSLEQLSSREMQVLQLIASGKMVSEIASLIYLSVNTVSTYRSRILDKLNLNNNAELTRYAMEHGIA